LRDHTHSDYNSFEPIPKKSRVVQLLEDRYRVLSILTIRNPIDSYASLKKNGWVRFQPSSFEEYCRRLLILCSRFEESRIFKYEDFVMDPVSVMNGIAQKLQIPTSDFFQDIYSAFRVTGDSGRTSNVIEMKSRRPISDEFRVEVDQSESFKVLSNKFEYW